MKNFEKLLELANENKKRRTNEHKETTYHMLHSNEIYAALIVDAEYMEDDSFIVLCLAIIKDCSYIEKTFKFKVFNGSSVQYEAICEILGTNGDPTDLIGKYIYMHIERNGDYRNLRVDGKMDKNEFEEMIADINSKSIKGKRKINSKNTPYVKPFFKNNDITDEEEFLEDEEEE